MIRILMVCMGNICRSPMALSALQGLLDQRQQAHRFEVDSAGTYAGHQGEPADPRAIAVASARGYRAIHQERARRVVPQDFERFDLILAMDRDNLMHLEHQCPPQFRHKLHLYLVYAGVTGTTEVPDPYYGKADGFEKVMRLCEAGALGVLSRLDAEPVGD
ncbi:MAG TPA: low molecular weight protein-tyrosine-phosphatase, partial [Hydrogenophaga sp.]|nr:low molecular weight protein-tyrosine-phosphatase [Hydrogenophaga sp.]